MVDQSPPTILLGESRQRREQDDSPNDVPVRKEKKSSAASTPTAPRAATRLSPSLDPRSVTLFFGDARLLFFSSAYFFFFSSESLLCDEGGRGVSGGREGSPSTLTPVGGGGGHVTGPL